MIQGTNIYRFVTDQVNLEFTDVGDLNGICWTPGAKNLSPGKYIGGYPTKMTPVVTWP